MMFLLRSSEGRPLGTVPILNVQIGTGFIWFAFFALLGAVGIGAMFVSETVMLADIVDYGEYKLGYRTDSIVFSMKSFLLKVAYSLQSAIMGIGLTLGNYNAAPGGEPARNAISAMAFGVPVLLIVLSFLVFLRKYKLHGDFYYEIMKTLRVKHAAEEGTASGEEDEVTA